MTSAKFTDAASSNENVCIRAACRVFFLAVLIVLATHSAEATETTSTSALNDTPCFSPVINNQVFTSGGTRVPTTEAGPRDCAEVQSAGHTRSGRYRLYPDDGGDSFFVYCDMETSDGGWTVFQRREGGFLDFYRTWSEYKNGFGPVVGEHWLGNDKIHRLTSQKRYVLRVDLWDWDGNTVYAEYDLFIVLGEESQYQLVLGEYHGNAGDSMTEREKGQPFSTRDADHDSTSSEHCAGSYSGGWWYKDCYYANLNGHFYDGGQYTPNPKSNGVVWYYLKDSWTYSLKRTELKIRQKPNE